MNAPLDWSKQGSDWPNRKASRFVEAGGGLWHVQRSGKGIQILLIHGTGASSHSWAGVFQQLSARGDVLAMDLPGHGFTHLAGPASTSLPGMVEGLLALLVKEKFAPDIIIGHSAGAAIALQLSSTRKFRPRMIIGLNAALKPFGGPASWLAPLIARSLAANPIVIRAIAWRARDPRQVSRLIEGTGSKLPQGSVELYARLFQAPGHIAGTLSMMASWDIKGIVERFGPLGIPLHLIAGSKDSAVAPHVSTDLACRHSFVTTEIAAGLGHLAHEEEPETIVKTIVRAMDQALAREGAIK